MTQRNKNGQFITGKSGNPLGRPSSDTTVLRNLLAENAEHIIQITTEAALRGDLQACKMILDRIIPPLKPQAAPIQIELSTKADLTLMAETLIRKAAEGVLASDVAAQMIAAIGQFARIREELPTQDEAVRVGKVEIRVIDPNCHLKNYKDGKEDTTD